MAKKNIAKKLKGKSKLAIVLVVLAVATILFCSYYNAPAKENTPGPSLGTILPVGGTVREPQLQITTVTIKPPIPKLDDSVTFRVTIKNVGIGSSPATTVKLSVDGTQINEVPLGIVLQGETQAVTMDSWTATSGNHTVVAEVVPVANEVVTKDNTYTATFTI